MATRAEVQAALEKAGVDRDAAQTLAGQLPPAAMPGWLSGLIPVFAAALLGLLGWGVLAISDLREDVARLDEKVVRLDEKVAGLDEKIERVDEKIDLVIERLPRR